MNEQTLSTPATPRIGDWMQVYTGGQFWPFDPRPEEVHIEDIAHALSMQCRYAGHVPVMYSVAQHSVHVAECVEDSDFALHALLHDASEAYVQDIIRPVKRSLAGYAEIEQKVMDAIAIRFGLGDRWEMPECVKHADERILATERRDLFPVTPARWNVDAEPVRFPIAAWPIERAREAFLHHFHWLMRRRG